MLIIRDDFFTVSRFSHSTNSFAFVNTTRAENAWWVPVVQQELAPTYKNCDGIENYRKLSQTVRTYWLIADINNCANLYIADNYVTYYNLVRRSA